MAPPSQRKRRQRRRRQGQLRVFAAACVVIGIASVASITISAQQLPVPAPDSLEKWAAAQETAKTTASAPLGPQFSFVRAPKPHNAQQQQGTPGVALGGGGSNKGGGGGAATKARASFVGLGDPLPPGLAKRWKDPSIPIDIDTEEVTKKEGAERKGKRTISF